jgi:transcriptional regulator with XRE-family HTH domain
MVKTSDSTGRRRRRSEHPDPVDVHVGARMRMRRTLLGLSQEKLGDALGLTFQQVQKYERGANRVGASRLHQLSRALDVPVSYFFDEMSDGDPSPPGPPAADDPPAEADPMTRRETLELVRAYYRIRDPSVRRRVFELTKTLAKAEEETSGT